MFKQKCSGYSSKHFNVGGYDTQSKINVFTDAVDYCHINTIFEWYLHYPDLEQGCRKH